MIELRKIPFDSKERKVATSVVKTGDSINQKQLSLKKKVVSIDNESRPEKLPFRSKAEVEASKNQKPRYNSPKRDFVKQPISKPISDDIDDEVAEAFEKEKDGVTPILKPTKSVHPSKRGRNDNQFGKSRQPKGMLDKQSSSNLSNILKEVELPKQKFNGVYKPGLDIAVTIELPGKLDAPVSLRPSVEDVIKILMRNDIKLSSPEAAAKALSMSKRELLKVIDNEYIDKINKLDETEAFKVFKRMEQLLPERKTQSCTQVMHIKHEVVHLWLRERNRRYGVRPDSSVDEVITCYVRGISNGSKFKWAPIN